MLNPQQQAIVACKSGNYLVSAVPGSGKTTCVTHRIASLLSDGVPSGAILGLTFTNKAAKEMRDRLQKLVVNKPVPLLATFHSFCARQLREYHDSVGRTSRFNILDQSDQERLIKQLVKSAGWPEEQTPKSFIKGILRFLEATRENLESPEQASFRLDVHADQILIAKQYLELLPKIDAFDFTGLMESFYQLLRDNQLVREHFRRRFIFLLVDEFQDTNAIQYEMVKLLCSTNVMVVGDLDQSIFGFRNALPENLLQFEKDFKATALFLEHNYRSTPEILRYSQQLIEHNKKRKETVLTTTNKHGRTPEIIEGENEEQMVQDIITTLRAYLGSTPLGNVAVLYRTNACSMIWERALRRMRLPYKLIGALSFFARQEIKLSLSVLKALNNPRDGASFLQTCEFCCKGFGDKRSQEVLELSISQHITPEEAARSITNLASLTKFIALFDEARKLSPAKALSHILTNTSTWDDFKKDSTVDNNRCENISTLCCDLEEHMEKGGNLEDYLEQAVLASGTDIEGDASSINLMTIHASKGLEFDIVVVSHLVEGKLPHVFALGAESQEKAIEEERRLLYVAMTRARKVLLLGHFEYDHHTKYKPSRFIRELLGY